MNKEIIVGLIKGRHEMPVEGYIFENPITDMFDYNIIQKHIYDWISTNVGISKVTGIGINAYGSSDDYVDRGDKHLIVYVTGLTCVTAELIRCCAYNGVGLTLMNFDSSTGEYKSQKIFQ